MPNHVLLGSDGIIRSYLEGDQDEVAVSQLVNKTAELMHGAGQKPDSRFDFIVDMSNVGSQTLDARKVGFKALTSMPFNRIAIVGSNRFVRHTVALLIIASGHGERVQQFDNEADALEWIRRA